MAMLFPFISEKFNGVTWRMEIDSLSDTLFVEIRNSAEKLVSFSSVNLVTGKLNFKSLTVAERWLTGIEAAYNGVLLLYNYQSENSPVHKGLTAVDAITGEVLWSNYFYSLDHLSVNGPVLYNAQIQPKKLFIADVRTGLMVKPYQQGIDSEFVNDIILPNTIPSSFLKQKMPVEPYGNSVHYLEYNNLRIVSLHSLSGKTLQQHLYIIDDMQIVYEDVLNGDIQKIQPEAFIFYKKYLIYIKNKSELKAISLEISK